MNNVENPQLTIPRVSDSSFIFNRIKELISKQESNVIEYMNDHMSQDERNQHGENILRFLENANALIARIKIDMIVDGRCIDVGGMVSWGLDTDNLSN